MTTKNVYDWMNSNLLYEEFVFYYLLILIFWGFVGFCTFGFELEGMSLQYSLFANFCYFIVIAICMALTPFWYKLLFNQRSKKQKKCDIKRC